MFEEGTRVRTGQIIARIEHAELDAQLAAARAAVAEAETQLAQNVAAHQEDLRKLQRQRALALDGITTAAALTAAEAAADVSAARVKSGEAAIVFARARLRVVEEALENTKTVAMSVRERTTEIAVMLTLGFPASLIFFIAGEGLLMSIAGGVLGAGLAWIVVNPSTLGLAGGFIPAFGVSAANAGLGIGISGVIGLVAGVVPATSASRLKIVNALRRVA